MSRAFFSKTLPDRMASDSTDKQDLKAIAVSATERRTGLGQSAQALSSILAVQSAASILLTTFGPPFMPLLLTLALPRTYLDTSAPQLLLAWVWYIPVLAANGVLEAFVASASTPQDIHRQSRYAALHFTGGLKITSIPDSWMAIFSAVFVLSTGVFWKLGFQDVSLIYANMANLLSRILFAVDFITSYYKAQQARDLITWWDVLPSRAFVLGAITSGVIVRLYSTRYFISNILVAQGKRAVFNIAVLQHVALGGALAVSCAALWWMQTGRRLSLPSRKRL
jgi:oligosaccharide translocation protein RFT1